MWCVLCFSAAAGRGRGRKGDRRRESWKEPETLSWQPSPLGCPTKEQPTPPNKHIDIGDFSREKKVLQIYSPLSTFFFYAFERPSFFSLWFLEEEGCCLKQDRISRRVAFKNYRLSQEFKRKVSSPNKKQQNIRIIYEYMFPFINRDPRPPSCHHSLGTATRPNSFFNTCLPPPQLREVNSSEAGKRRVGEKSVLFRNPE